MRVAPLHPREEERLRALAAYKVLDTGPELAYNDVVTIASSICDTPIALVSLVGRDRQWFKARTGIDAVETPRDVAFCAHAILDVGIFEVTNALEDERFCDNPLVSGAPDIRFYAGTPLVSPEGLPLGTLCVIDRTPKELSDEQRHALGALGRQVVAQLELQKKVRRLDVMASELKRSNQDLEDFASVASHDLQEPLRKMQMFGDRLRRRLDGSLNGEANQDLDRMTGAALRMQRLVLDLLGLSRVRAKAGEFEPVDLGKILEDVLDDLQIKIQEEGGRIESGPLLDFEGEPLLLHQLLQNLISNALKFRHADQPPVIRVETTHEARHQKLPHAEAPLIHMTVADNGIGFDAQYAERIFRVFERLHGRTAYAGSGIGLALCRRIVEHHGGTIWAESRSGSGATFHVLLPERQTAFAADSDPLLAAA